MKQFAQILYNKAHWIFEDEAFPEFPPDAEGNPIIIIDITDKPEVQEGWDYNSETGEFTEPTPPEPIDPELEYVDPPSIEEQILAENQYQTALLEMQAMGGM